MTIQSLIKIIPIFVANERIYPPEDETGIDRRARVSAAHGSIIPIRRVSNELPQRIPVRSSI